jgi:hypothetical protein
MLVASVQDTLAGAKSRLYDYAARHLAECRSCEALIDTYGDFPAHAQFVEAHNQQHGRKHGFWQVVDE